MTSVLILYAHPAHDASRANRLLRAAIDGIDGVTVHDLYETYPDLMIDAAREQALLQGHESIVFQHPLYWYSAPAILKQWQDDVLEHGWAWGEGGGHLRGKRFMQAITTGGHPSSYRRDGGARFTIDELLRPFEQMAHYCGMICLAPFVVHAARLDADDVLANHAARYRALVERLTRGDFPAPHSTTIVD